VMITSEREIRALMTAPEQQLFDLSLSKELPKFSGPQIRAKLKRARDLRDKAQDTYRRQVMATQGRTGTKRGLTGGSNERTRMKAAALSGVVERLAAAATAADDSSTIH